MSSLSVLAIGLLLGVKHATEPDHLTAVAALATRNTSLSQTLRLGLAWGVGHTCTLMLIAGGVVVIGGEMPAALLPLLDGLIGLMLIGLGLDVLRRLARERRVAQPSATAQPDFSQLAFKPAPSTGAPAALPMLPRRALAVGMMHGMAGSAALIVLSLRSVSSLSEGLIYISLFGLGSMIGMAALSILLALPLRWSSRLPGRFNAALTAGIGVLSVLIGFWTIYQASH